MRTNGTEKIIYRAFLFDCIHFFFFSCLLNTQKGAVTNSIWCNEKVFQIISIEFINGTEATKRSFCKARTDKGIVSIQLKRIQYCAACAFGEPADDAFAVAPVKSNQPNDDSEDTADVPKSSENETNFWRIEKRKKQEPPFAVVVSYCSKNKRQWKLGADHKHNFIAFHNKFRHTFGRQRFFRKCLPQKWYANVTSSLRISAKTLSFGVS